MRFRDREQAGRMLAQALASYKDRPDVVVLALPRGGVPVGREVAEYLGAPLDVLIVRKLGHPWQPELAVGAVASGGVVVLNPEVLSQMNVNDRTLRQAAEREWREIARRESVYRGTRLPIDVAKKTVIVVDDGIATGSTVRAGLEALRARGPARIVVAVPVAPATTIASLRNQADEVVCLHTPEDFVAVGLWYSHFHQLTDDEVRRLLAAVPRT